MSDESTVEMDQTVTDKRVLSLIDAAQRLKSTGQEYAKKQNYPGENLDIPPMITAYRGETPICSAVCHNMGDDLFLATGVIITGLEADQVTVLAEGFTATVGINPLTGQEWGERDMEFLYETDPDQEVVKTCLFLHVLTRPESELCTNKESPHVGVVLPYSVNKDKEVTWGEARCQWFNTDDSDMAFPGVATFFSEESLRVKVLRDVEAGTASITKTDWDRLEADYGAQMLVDVFTMRLVNDIEGVRSAGLLFPADSERYDLFSRIMSGAGDAEDLLESFGVSAQKGWKIRKIEFSSDNPGVARMVNDDD